VFRLTNVIPERIIFVSRCITVSINTLHKGDDDDDDDDNNNNNNTLAYYSHLERR